VAARSPHNRLSLLILAAGESRRLGAPKALVPLREAPPVHPLGILLEAARPCFGPAPLVVAGAHATAIREALDGEVELLVNPRWAQGRTGGVLLAHDHRPTHDLCIAPVDVPAVEGAVFSALVQAWAEAGAPARGWLAPSLGDEQGRKRFGHPIVCGHLLLDEISGLDPDTPLKALRDRAHPLLDHPVEVDTILDDLDTTEDLERIRLRFRS